jgi:uncharacterized protein
MPQLYATPGVHREDVFPTPLPDLPTGIPVFLGLTSTVEPQHTVIPVNTPRSLTLWTQFQQYFGVLPADRYLADAVRGFFENGGERCYVILLQDDSLDALAAGLAAAELLDVDLICAPDLVAKNPPLEQVLPLQQLVLEHCNRMGDRFAILDSVGTIDGSKKPSPSAIQTSAMQAVHQQQQQLASDNGALYFPWLQLEQGTYVPPSGHIAGIYARSDRAVGIHKPPANYGIEGIVDLSHRLSDRDQAQLNPDEAIAGINCLRALPGRGIRVWGARTLSRDSNWQYINVRRLFITVHRWIERNLADIAFEPNDFKLWVRIERELTAYFESLLQQGALQGLTPQEAFYVKCDAETNPLETRGLGNVITEIGLAPMVPAEFIVIRLIHSSTGVAAAAA